MMVSNRWQRQHIQFQRIVWGISAVISILLIVLFLLLGFGMEVAGVFFIVVFVLMRISLAFIFKNRYGNSLVRVLKFNYEEIERDFRIVFKNNNIRYYRKAEDDAYLYEFPGRNLSMTVQPYWLSPDGEKPATKVTLLVLNEKNKEFAGALADSIDEMADQRANRLVKA